MLDETVHYIIIFIKQYKDWTKEVEYDLLSICNHRPTFLINWLIFFAEKVSDSKRKHLSG